ncbi:MAG: cell division protein FtsQ/DivIB [Geminicoccales bacterium]
MRRMTLAARRARIYLRRPPRPRWWRPAVYGGGAALAISVIVALGFWLGSAGLAQRAFAAVTDGALGVSADLGLSVREVYAVGRVRTGQAELRAQLGIEIGEPILALDPDAARARLEQLPWVAQASVVRLLPDRVQVRLIERQPLALWQRPGRFALVDRGGAVIDPNVDGQEWQDAAPEARHGQLRVLVGDQAPRHAARLFALLSTEPALWGRVIAATWVGDRRWTLRLDNQIDVLMPERDMLRAWRFLADKARDEALLERAVSVVDLRFLPNRLRLRLDPAALQDNKA